MTASTEGAARRIYRVLLRAYPRAMRERCGEEMEETFLALLGWEGERRGGHREGECLGTGRLGRCGWRGAQAV